MIIKHTYFIKRNDNYIWLAQDIKPLQTDEVVEIRKMLIAKEGYTLSKDGKIIDVVLWIKDDDNPENYTEVELPPEPEEEDEQPE